MKVKDLFVLDEAEAEALIQENFSDEVFIKKVIEPCKNQKNLKPFCVSYIERWRGKIVDRVFAVKKIRKEIVYREIMRKVEGNGYIVARNLYSAYMFGWKVAWEDSKTYFFDKRYLDIWDIYNCNINITRNYINPEKIFKYKSLKYCAWNTKSDVCNYVTIYRKYPEIEMLSKLGLSYLIKSTKVLNKLQDKSFRKYLCRLEINDVYGININELFYGYKNNIHSLNEIRNLKNLQFTVNGIIKEFPFIDKKKLEKYITTNKEFDKRSYHDMIKAEQYLKLDMNDNKNLFPKDFKYWHDFYTSQVRLSQNKEIDEGILKQASKFKKLEMQLDDFQIILPHSSEDLIEEGNALHHCVGRMDYNKKIAEGKTLIVFVRSKENEHLSTIQFDPKNKSILQFSADHNQQPPLEVQDCIYNKWLPKAKRLRIS